MKYLYVNDHKCQEKVVYLLVDKFEQQLIDGLRKYNCIFTLVQVDDWNNDLSPYPCEALKTHFKGEASKTLKYLHELIVKELPQWQIKYRYIGGYSLAGLFSLYSLINDEVWDGGFSCSGSLWYPNFIEVVEQATFNKAKKIYLSLGDSEHLSKNPLLKTISDNTKAVKEILTKKGLKIEFQLNVGGHFVQVNERIEKAIQWLCEV